MSNSKEFNQAAEYVKNLKTKPDNEELSKLYGLFKQAKFGDNNNDKPSFINFKETKKWSSWNENKGKTKYDSEVEYITLVNSLIKKYGIKK